METLVSFFCAIVMISSFFCTVHGDLQASVFHTRLRLDFSVLNYYFFSKRCFFFYLRTFWNANAEDAKHFSLYHPRFGPLSGKLFASAAHLQGPVRGIGDKG